MGRNFADSLLVHCISVFSESCEKVVSQEAITKLGMSTENHPRPHKLSRFKKGNEVIVNSRCLISFSIDNKYFDNVLCNVVVMDACHLLLDRLWQYDHKVVDNEKKIPIPSERMTKR